jgi:hypothetical protein
LQPESHATYGYSGTISLALRYPRRLAALLAACYLDDTLSTGVRPHTRGRPLPIGDPPTNRICGPEAPIRHLRTGPSDTPRTRGRACCRRGAGGRGARGQGRNGGTNCSWDHINAVLGSPAARCTPPPTRVHWVIGSRVERREAAWYTERGASGIPINGTSGHPVSSHHRREFGRTTTTVVISKIQVARGR